MKSPVIDLELITALTKQFPDQVPDIHDSDRVVWSKVGEQRVIRYLARLYEEQNENLLEQKVL